MELAAKNTDQVPGSWIKETSAPTFMQDVIQPSLQVPVLLYFTAPWCGPCKQLGPMLEKIVNEAAGKLRLVKVNIDNNREIAAQFRVQSVPTVFAFFQGQPMDAFMGALPESQIRQFIARLGVEGGGNETEAMLEEAEQVLAEGQPDAALEIFKAINAKEPENTQAIGGILKCFVAKAEFDEAQKLYDLLPDTMRTAESVSAAKAALELARAATQNAAGLQESLARLKKNPNDQQARLDVAVQNFALGKQEEAIDELLGMIQKDRAWNEEAARKQLLNFFEILGHTNPLTMAARRRLSALIFS